MESCGGTVTSVSTETIFNDITTCCKKKMISPLALNKRRRQCSARLGPCPRTATETSILTVVYITQPPVEMQLFLLVVDKATSTRNRYFY